MKKSCWQMPGRWSMIQERNHPQIHLQDSLQERARTVYLRVQLYEDSSKLGRVSLNFLAKEAL